MFMEHTEEISPCGALAGILNIVILEERKENLIPDALAQVFEGHGAHSRSFNPRSAHRRIPDPVRGRRTLCALLSGGARAHDREGLA